MNDFLKDLGNRIKLRREELKMTQNELALMAGYTSHSSIAKIEMGLVDLSQSKIEKISKALKTTPAYIMGWTKEIEQNKSPISKKNEITEERLIALGVSKEKADKLTAKDFALIESRIKSYIEGLLDSKN